MGLTWIMGFVAGYLDLDAVWYIYVALTSFQVSIIYIIQSDLEGKINNLWIMGFVATYLDLEAVWYIYVALNSFQVSVIYTIQDDSEVKINN
jgi:hypothetical protein